MSFSQGKFDFLAQIDKSAVDVVIDVILKTLQTQGKTRFTKQFGGNPLGGQVDVELVDLLIPQLRARNANNRFANGGTLMTFQADAQLMFRVVINGVALNPTQDRLGIKIKDLAVDIVDTPGGLPVGIALGFRDFDIAVTGLQGVAILNTALNAIVDLVALGIRTAFAPLNLVPIPILQFADAFAQYGLKFEKSNSQSPHIGVSQSQTALYLAADFENPSNNPGNIALVTDILSPTHNAGVVVNQRLINQTVGILLATGEIPGHIQSGGTSFRINYINVAFESPRRRASRVVLDAGASARVRSSKGGFFGSLFGSSRVTVYADAHLEIESDIVIDPATQLPEVKFDFDGHVVGQAVVTSVLFSVFTTFYGPYLSIFFFVLSQLLNFGVKFFSPIAQFKLKLSGIDVFEVEIEKLNIQLSGASLGFLGDYFMQVKLTVGGQGTLRIGLITNHAIVNTGLPLKVNYTGDSLLTRGMNPTTTEGGDLYIGLELKI